MGVELGRSWYVRDAEEVSLLRCLKNVGRGGSSVRRSKIGQRLCGIRARNSRGIDFATPKKIRSVVRIGRRLKIEDFEKFGTRRFFEIRALNIGDAEEDWLGGRPGIHLGSGSVFDSASSAFER